MSLSLTIVAVPLTKKAASEFTIIDNIIDTNHPPFKEH